VPSLYDLLRPADQRPHLFHLGSTEFDPARVGFIQRQHRNGVEPFLYRVRDANGGIITGNSNQGHQYGAYQLNETERLELLEFLKTL